MSYGIVSDSGLNGPSSLTHTYYFITSILVRKLRKSRIRIPGKRGYFGTHLLEFGEKGVNFDVLCFTVKRCSFGLKSQCFDTKKGVRFGLKSQCFIVKKGLF